MATKFMSQAEKDQVGIINRQLTLSEATVVSGEAATGPGRAALRSGAPRAAAAAQPLTDSAPTRSAEGDEVHDSTSA